MTEDFKQTHYWKLVEEFVNELKTAKYWLKNDGKPLPEWKLFETRAAAGSAAGATAGNAAGNAAVDTAWDAAWDAARDAAYDAARDAPYDVAYDAAVFARMLVCEGLPMKKEHLIHLNARMEVWRKGYGLRCDVNGTLYVYKKV